MRASITPQNTPLFEHTLMPTHMTGFFSAQEMAGVELIDPLPFTKEMKVLRTPAAGFITPFMFGTQLFDLATDPDQASPLDDADLELRMATALRDELVRHDAPASQFERLGLPVTGPLDESHLLVAAQWPQLQNSLAPAATSADFGEEGAVLDVPLRELLTRPAAVEVFTGLAPMLTGGPMAGFLGGLSLIQISSVAIGLLPRPLLAALASHLTAATAGEPVLS